MVDPRDRSARGLVMRKRMPQPQPLPEGIEILEETPEQVLEEQKFQERIEDLEEKLAKQRFDIQSRSEMLMKEGKSTGGDQMLNVLSREEQKTSTELQVLRNSASQEEAQARLHIHQRQQVARQINQDIQKKTKKTEISIPSKKFSRIEKQKVGKNILEPFALRGTEITSSGLVSRRYLPEDNLPPTFKEVAKEKGIIPAFEEVTIPKAVDWLNVKAEQVEKITGKIKVPLIGGGEVPLGTSTEIARFGLSKTGELAGEGYTDMFSRADIPLTRTTEPFQVPKYEGETGIYNPLTGVYEPPRQVDVKSQEVLTGAGVFVKGISAAPEVLAYTNPYTAVPMLTSDIIIAGEKQKRIEQETIKLSEEAWKEYLKTELPEGERYLTKEEWKKEINPLIKEDLKKNIAFGLATAGVFLTGIGAAKSLKFIRKPILTKVDIPSPKLTLKTNQIVGVDAGKAVFYPRQQVSQVGIGGQRQVVTSRVRDWFGMKEIYKGVPYKSPKGYSNALKKLQNYGYDLKGAKEAIRYKAPRVMTQELIEGKILIPKKVAYGKTSYITKQPKILVDETLGIKTRGKKPEVDVELFQRYPIGKKGFVYGQMGTTVKPKKIKEIRFEFGEGLGKSSETKKGFFASKDELGIVMKPAEYKTLGSVERPFGGFGLRTSEASLFTKTIDVKGGKVVSSGKKTPLSQTFQQEQAIKTISTPKPTKIQPKTKERIIPEEVSIPKTQVSKVGTKPILRTDLDTKIQTKTELKDKTKLKQELKTAYLLKQIDKTLVKPLINLKSGQKSVQKVKSASLLKQGSALKQPIATRTALTTKGALSKTPKPSPFFKPVPFLKDPTPVNERLVKAIKKLGKSNVDVIVGMKIGKKKVIGKNLPKWKALKKAQDYVDNNIEASFILKKSKGNTNKKDIKPFVPSNKFRASKTNPLYRVEKRKYRLDSPREIKQLNMFKGKVPKDFFPKPKKKRRRKKK